MVMLEGMVLRVLMHGLGMPGSLNNKEHAEGLNSSTSWQLQRSTHSGGPPTHSTLETHYH